MFRAAEPAWGADVTGEDDGADDEHFYLVTNTITLATTAANSNSSIAHFELGAGRVYPGLFRLAGLQPFLLGRYSIKRHRYDQDSH
ncbi:MAG: hypothetical protein VX075_16185 [Pseudomonadota bacterium]|nr:hypothetical protein [Pseudomonadota bacterium]